MDYQFNSFCKGKDSCYVKISDDNSNLIRKDLLKPDF
jgi:hypothetical protein